VGCCDAVVVGAENELELFQTTKKISPLKSEWQEKLIEFTVKYLLDTMFKGIDIIVY